MTRILVTVLFSSFVFSACGGSGPAGQADAQKAAATLTGDDARGAADNPQCKLFTQAEVAKYIGEPVSAGRNAALGLGCQWVATDGSGDAIVAVVPSNYHERPSEATGFKELTGVGMKAFVAPQLDGWTAGAIEGEDAIKVSVAGAGAGESSAVALLKETIRRRAS